MKKVYDYMVWLKKPPEKQDSNLEELEFEKSLNVNH